MRPHAPWTDQGGAAIFSAGHSEFVEICAKPRGFTSRRTYVRVPASPRAPGSNPARFCFLMSRHFRAGQATQTTCAARYGRSFVPRSRSRVRARAACWKISRPRTGEGLQLTRAPRADADCGADSPAGWQLPCRSSLRVLRWKPQVCWEIDCSAPNLRRRSSLRITGRGRASSVPRANAFAVIA